MLDKLENLNEVLAEINTMSSYLELNCIADDNSEMGAIQRLWDENPNHNPISDMAKIIKNRASTAQKMLAEIELACLTE